MNTMIVSKSDNKVSGEGEFRLLSLATIIMLLAISMYISLAVELIQSESSINTAVFSQEYSVPLALQSI